MDVVTGNSAPRDVGVVVIGRNEGDRLRRSLESLAGLEDSTVYVDSGSTDGSPELARARGIEVVPLDLDVPFTAGRARNVGFARLLERHPGLEFVQFIDGDCEVLPGWIEQAREVLRTRPDVAVVCGRRVERFPEASIYNRLCDMEWNTPVREQTTSGGDAMMRVGPLVASGGYHPGLVGGEEPDLCLRLRKQGWNVVRIAADMTLHDAAMTRFGQWWKRTQRTGHAAAMGWVLHGRSPDHQYVRNTLRSLFWAALGPGLVLAALVAAASSAAALAVGFLAAVPILYAVPFLRARRSRLERGDPPAHATLYAGACVLAKWPEALGVLGVWHDRLRGRQPHWIEYKDFRPVGPGRSS